MKEITYTQLCETLQSLNGKTVQVNVIGTIKIPFVYSDFECVCTDEGISFGEHETELYPFNITRNIITGIKKYDMLVESDVWVVIKTQVDDIFTTYIEILYNS
jgi:hypothetical protein